MTETKEEALKLLERTRKEFVIKCRQYAFEWLKTHETITIDDVRAANPLPDGVDGRVFGTIFTDDFKKVGMTRTKRKTSHRRPIGIFKLR